MPEPIEIRREKVYVDTSLSIAEIKRKYNTHHSSQPLNRSTTIIF